MLTSHLTRRHFFGRAAGGLGIAALAGDSWKASEMRRYFERVQRGYLPGEPGWMPLEVHLDDLVDLLVSAVDLKMLRVIVATVMLR